MKMNLKEGLKNITKTIQLLFQISFKKTSFPQNMNKTTLSEKARRNYPKYMKGQKNEWIGLVHHQQEINDELGKIEKEIKILTAKTLK